MKISTACLTTLALAVTLGTAPALALSTNGPQSVTFDTAFAPEFYGAGEYDGVLHLTFAADGTVSGWYRSTDTAGFRTVTGGLSGTKLWLDLGGRGAFPIQATYVDGKIVGSAYFGNQPYTFTGKPEKSP